MNVTDGDVALLFTLAKQAQGSGERIISALRSRFPGLRFSQCPASDVTEEPFQVGEMFDLYLLDTRDHCWTVTSDVASATGFLLAMHGSNP